MTRRRETAKLQSRFFQRGREATQTGRALTFHEWWAEKVLNGGSGQILTREKVIRILRDKDGGAHYDADIKDPLVAAALQGQITGIMYKNTDGKIIPVPLGLENTMRQIAGELRMVFRYLRLIHDPSFKPYGPTC